MKKIGNFVILPLLVVCLCVFLGGAITLPDIRTHNMTLSQYANEFRKIEHPPSTSHISFHSSVGLIVGNGNHCDYFVGEMRRFTGDRREIEALYSKQKVNGKSIFVAFVENGKFAQADRLSMPSGLDDPYDWVSSSKEPLTHVYVAYILDIGHPPGLDIRCH